MSKEITKKDDVKVTQVTSSTDSFITQALASNASVEVLTQLFQLQKDVKAEQAKEAYTQAMAQFQANCPTIKKTKNVEFSGKVQYSYAPLEVIKEQTGTLIADNGFIYSFDTVDTENAVTAICKVTHKDGHSETSSFTSPSTAVAKMNAQQSKASAVTYAKRMAFQNAFGIMVADEDDDATGVKDIKKPVDNKAKIVFLLKALSYNTETKESVANAVLAVTKLPLEEKNFPKIVEFLEFAVSEKNADKSKE